MENQEKTIVLNSVLEKLANNEALTKIEYLVFKEAKNRKEGFIYCLELKIEDSLLQLEKLKKE